LSVVRIKQEPGPEGPTKLGSFRGLKAPGSLRNLRSELQDGAFFDAEVMVQDGGGHLAGEGVECDCALFAELRKEQFAARCHLLGGCGAEHLLDVGGDGAGNGGDLGLSHGYEQDDVTMKQLRRAVDDFRAHGGFGEVGDPQD